MTPQNSKLKSARSSLWLVSLRVGIVLSSALFLARFAHAGGPKFVAGSTYFNSSSMGQPVTWSLGQVNYYTDQGDLSPILPNAAANSFVASAFSQWTSIPGAALVATNAGRLAEDVNGNNISVDGNGAVTAPPDITSSATQTPVGIVYDYDGTVTDALLGAGAGNPSQCFSDAVYGGADNFSTGANFLHALVIINGQCALQSSQLVDVEYRLVRVIGSVLGLGWSQNNLNVITGNPPATADDYAGFPVMHELDQLGCVPITACYPNPYQLAADDMAALSRLYPATSGGASSARIHGSVYFVNSRDQIVQPMQGVNVVARWIDPSTGQPSHKYSAASVSGFLFTGNAGNPITGWTDPLGSLYTNFGSSDQAVEGFFDLGGLPVPNGAGTAQYQLAVEALDPLWSGAVCPYVPFQVAPSGVFPPVIVTVNAGGDIEQDILVSGGAQAVPSWASTQTWNAPAPVPQEGDWIGSLSGYGDVGYFLISAQANRTLSVAITALDETGAPSEAKTAPVVGIWSSTDPQGTAPPTFTPVPFNSETFGMTRLDAQVLASASFIVGVGDLRGDGRPDYHYHAHVLYADTVNSPRIPVAGGAFTLQGIGFTPGLNVSVGSTSVPVLATNAAQMLATAPAQPDGPQTVTVSDPVSGAFSIMTNALTFGAAATDKIALMQGQNPQTPAGTQAANPVIVKVVAADGVTAVGGATVGWAATNGAILSSCGNKSSCTAISDESGIASTWVTPAFPPNNTTITATLAPGTYSPPKSVVATLSVTSSVLDIAVLTPFLWIASGASVSIPLTARVVSQGTQKSGELVNFFVDQGTGSLSSATTTTDNSGYASVTLTLTNFNASIQLSVCAGQANNPCQTVYGNAVAATMLNLQSVTGEGQVVSAAPFQPLIVRVTDSSKPPNPVLGANVLFQSALLRPLENNLELGSNSSTSQTGAPVILSTSQGSVQSDANGLASFIPSVGSFTGPLEIEIQISTGTIAVMQVEMETFSDGSSGMATLPKKLEPPKTPIFSIFPREIGFDDRR